jgi:hypothetical protein
MRVYHCHYQYNRKGNVYSEDNYLLANNELECRDLLEQVLQTRLSYFTYNISIDFVAGISKEIVDYISISNYERIARKKELSKMKDGYNYPDTDTLHNIEVEKVKTEPKPLINKVKNKLLQKYQ